MPQLACSPLRGCAAVFPKGVLAHARDGVWPPVRLRRGRVLRAPGEDLIEPGLGRPAAAASPARGLGVIATFRE